MPAPAEEPLMRACASDARQTFTSLEWLVIAIGARDESVPLQWTPFGRSLLALTGGSPRQLASPCLEMLRRTASVARHYGWSIPSADVGAFLLGGWTEDDLERIVESVGPREPSPDPRQVAGDIADTKAVASRPQPRTVMEIYA